MGRVLRGDLYWADLDPVRGREQAGRRPVLVLSQDIFNERSETVIALAITSRKPSAGFPISLEVHSVQLPKRSWIKISQIRTLSTERLGGHIGRLSPVELAQVVEGLNEIIG
jgi:mRNA interferase MazF